MNLLSRQEAQLQPEASLGIRSFLGEILDVLLPRVCPFCRRATPEGRNPFCAACTESFKPFCPPFCSVCGAPIPATACDPQWLVCTTCLHCPGPPWPASRVRCVGPYEGSLREAVLRLKYGREIFLAPALGKWMASRFRTLYPLDAFDLILPVPLHPARLRQREFNQSVLLARPLARALRLPLALRAVLRVRDTPSQSLYRRGDRRRNLQGAFRVAEPQSVRKRSVLLVDDVFTTGATAEALATLLLEAGAASVSVLCLARTVDPISGLSPVDREPIETKAPETKAP